MPEHDRSTPESRPSSGCGRFLGLEIRSDPDSRRRWARPEPDEEAQPAEDIADLKAKLDAMQAQLDDIAKKDGK